MRIIFCDNLLDRKSVDPDFEEEFQAAIANKLTCSLISFETLKEGDGAGAVARIKAPENEEVAIYRGWMLKPAQYELFYQALLQKNIRLVNSPTQYKNCHYLPDVYTFIREITPPTVWLKIEGVIDFEEIFELLKPFNNQPIIVKDYVKSQKHNWEEACFIPDASDKEHVKKVVTRFLELQGSDLNEGLLFRKFEQLEFLTNHSKSRMPLTMEFRLFFLKNELIHIFKYWDEGEYGNVVSFDVEKFSEVAKKVKSNFFTMDVAKRRDGEWIVMELGDGQVSGLPDNADKNQFYRTLKNQGRTPDFIAKLQYLTAEQGGHKKGPAYSKYRPHVKFPFSNHLTSGQQIFLDKEVVYPGESVTAEITLLTPELFKGALYEGLNFEFAEGPRLVGTGVIIEVLNQDLQKWM